VGVHLKFGDLRTSFSEMEAEMSFVARTRKPIGITASTGQKCPESGVWRVQGTPSTTTPIAEGNVMPPYGGKAVTWVLIQYA
jgi:hypothetical protein